jgi:hypothetical protein
MSDDSTTLDQGAGSNDGAKVVEVSKASFNRGKQQGKKEALGELQSRVRAINDLFDQYVAMFPNNEELRGLHMDLITSGATLDQARAALLAAMPSYIAQPTGTGFVQTEQRSVTAATPTRPATSVRDEVDSLGANVEAALLMRCGLGDKEQDKQLRESGVGGLTFVEMGRRYLEATGNGSQIRNLDKHGVAKVMLMRAGPMTHSDFPYLLANVATKIAKKGYTEANTTYQNWANIAYLPDFKPATIPGLGAFTDLDLIPQTGAPYVYGTMGEAYETATLATYGKLFGISRAAIVNDDLMQFSRAGLAMGAAAARKVNQLAYAILTAGQTMSEDSVTLWDVSTHANYVSSSGAAPSVTTLNVGEKAMGIQKAPRVSTDSTNAYLNISPGHLVVPLSLKATSSVLIESMYDPAGTAGTLPPNPWRGRLSVTADALLDANSTTAWYLIAPKGNSTIDTVTVFFLEGSNGEPYIEEEQQFSSDGVSYKVRIDAVARALDWRGMYKNAGT